MIHGVGSPATPTDMMVNENNGEKFEKNFSNGEFCPFAPKARRKFGIAEPAKTSQSVRKDDHNNEKHS